VSELGVLGRITVTGSDLGQVQCGADDGIHFLSPSARGGDPQPDGVAGDAEHRAARHEVSDSMSPPGVVVVLVHQVLPGHQLEEEDASADSRSDDGPAADEEVAGVVSNHVVQGKSESSGSESPGDSDALEEHQEK